MDEMGREIEVRSVDGSSMVVSVPADRTIGDLKVLLKDSFLPAKQAPNFHLFFKGAKLSTESQINSHLIKSGEFIVLVPFTKKTRNEGQQDPSEQGTTMAQCSHQSTSSSFADSAWLDIMQDISSLSNVVPQKETMSSDYVSSNDMSNRKKNLSMNKGFGDHCPNAKRHKRERYTHGFLRDILCSDCTSVLNQQTKQRFHQVLDLVDCLSDLRTGNCLLFEELCRCSEEAERCMCPSWLRRLVKCFTFLNIFYGLYQMHRKWLTWSCLKETLRHPGDFGLEDIGISDVEHLLVVCPKVVMLGEQEKTKLGEVIIIFDSSIELEDQSGPKSNCRKCVSSSSIINAIEKRESTFKTDLWRVIKYVMSKTASGNIIPFSLSLENLISMKDYIAVSEGTEVKSERTRSLTPNAHSGQTRCCGTNPLQPMEMVEHLRKGFGIRGQIVHVEEINAKLAVHVGLPGDLSETTLAALRGIGVSRLYSHQGDAIRASLSGKSVVVATSTSSGKSLCYNLPVLEELCRNLLLCAVYLFPTKALAQDQLRSLLDMIRGLDTNLVVGVYDGDTSQEHRTWLRDNARLLITNPDMLHMSILPFHTQFERILSNLRFVVIDEAHTYKGAFGCHTALILRRLRRICCHVYGNDPSFIFSTATSVNPREHAMALANLQSVELIQNDGSPCGPKLFLLWNPLLCLTSGLKTQSSRKERKFSDGVAVRSSSPILEASGLFAEMVQHGLRCIAFCKTRKLTELVLCYTREILQETAPSLVDSISGYRAGYTAQDRRRIEIDLFSGKLQGVAATNALELGIDVGHIDATLHLGFPGSVASLWQQAGRSGRRVRPSLAVYIAFEGPLDQYFMKFPQKLFRSPLECCQVDANNEKVLEQHVACAARELPLNFLYDEKYFGSGLNIAVSSLKNKGYLGGDPHRVSSARLWSYIGPEKNPSHAVSIRAIETEKYKVVDKLSNEVLEEIEESRAFFQVYEGAVYIHQGITYLVKVLDLSEKIAFCQKADLKYYTKTRDYTDIHVIGGHLAYPPMKMSEINYMRITAHANTCNVTTNWFGFYRIWRGSNRIFDRVDLALPIYSYESQAVWIRVPQSIKEAVEKQELSFRAGQHAASHAVLNVVPLYIMCNASDMSTECANPHETRNVPERILLYDQHPGGIGLSVQVQPLFGDLLIAALELIRTCNCLGDAGCPNCVQTLSCHEYNEVLDKKAAIMILKGIVEAENSYFEGSEESIGSSSAKQQTA